MLPLAKAILLWAAIIPFAIGNGVLRERVLSPRMNPARARAASGVLLSAIIIAYATATIGWLEIDAPKTALRVGALWLGCTVAFEFGFGRLIAKKPWKELLGAYAFRDGELWPVVLLTVALAPWLAYWIRHD